MTLSLIAVPILLVGCIFGVIFGDF